MNKLLAFVVAATVIANAAWAGEMRRVDVAPSAPAASGVKKVETKK